MKIFKLIYSSAIAAITAIVAVTAATIASEMSHAFKNWLQSVTGHHWITKSWLSIIVFISGFLAVYFLAREPDDSRLRFALIALILSVWMGSAIIIGFFIWEYI